MVMEEAHTEKLHFMSWRDLTVDGGQNLETCGGPCALVLTCNDRPMFAPHEP